MSSFLPLQRLEILLQYLNLNPEQSRVKVSLAAGRVFFFHDEKEDAKRRKRKCFSPPCLKLTLFFFSCSLLSLSLSLSLNIRSRRRPGVSICSLWGKNASIKQRRTTRKRKCLSTTPGEEEKNSLFFLFCFNLLPNRWGDDLSSFKTKSLLLEVWSTAFSKQFNRVSR